MDLNKNFFKKKILLDLQYLINLLILFIISCSR